MLNANEQKIVFGAGCFWGVQKYFSSLNGVTDTRVGYAGGNFPSPNYEKVLHYRQETPDGLKNYTEAVEVIYEPEKISTEELIKRFWELHDPTQLNRQGNDIGNNYRSAIYYTTKEQKEIALKTKEEYQKLLSKAGYGKIVTEIESLDSFYEAESYHQHYLLKNPKGYCPNHATGVKFEQKSNSTGEKISPIGGKEIIVVESQNCPYCKKFREVLDGYRGSTPLRVAEFEQLSDFELNGKIEATPTTIFIEDGKERYRHIGYMSEEEFYRALGAFKLGEGSEAFNIAFNQGTENRFCKQYDRFKNTPDGVFVDRLSGDILFDTRDRFNSGSGWLSFYRAVDGAVEEREDLSYGMRRTEVIAKKSKVHLGHVFDDAPGGKRRYCINANVLEFIPRDKLKK